MQDAWTYRGRERIAGSRSLPEASSIGHETVGSDPISQNDDRYYRHGDPPSGALLTADHLLDLAHFLLDLAGHFLVRQARSTLRAAE